MAQLEPDLLQHLKAQSALMAIVDGVYAGRVPAHPETSTAVAFYRIAADRAYCLESELDVCRALMVIAAIAKGEQAAQRALDAFEQIRAALSMYRGQMNGGVFIHCATLESETLEMPFEPLDASDDWPQRYLGNWRISYTN